MKFKVSKEIEVKDPKITIKISSDNNWEPSISAVWTCPNCAGHGCNSFGNKNDPECKGGDRSLSLTGKELETSLNHSDLTSLRITIEDLARDLDINF